MRHSKILNGLFSLAFVASGCGGTELESEGYVIDESLLNSASSALRITGVRASRDDGNVPSNVIDGKLATRWSAEGKGQWIELDLGAKKKIEAIRIAFHKGTTRKSKFDLIVSDGVTSRRVLSNTYSSGQSDALETFTFAPVEGRYVRYVGYKNSSNGWNSLTEVEVTGSASSEQTPDTDPLPTPPTPPTLPTPPTGDVPAAVLDLTNWKLTLPINTARAGSPDEIRQPELSTFALAPHFLLDTTQGAVIFRANAGGATTGGSSYPRSELREMASNGSANASWSTSSGTHTMFVREAITHLPVVKPHVVAAQIHDAEDDVVMVRLEGRNLFVEGGGADLGTLDANYVLGTIFEIKMVGAGGRIKVYYNDVLKADIARSVTGCYFKAGCYTQSNTSKGDAATAYGEVIIYELTVTHSN